MEQSVVGFIIQILKLESDAIIHNSDGYDIDYYLVFSRIIRQRYANFNLIAQFNAFICS